MKIVRTIQACENCVFRNLLFDSLNQQEFRLVNNARTEKVFHKGEIIKREGDEFNSFLYLRTGLVKLYKTDQTGKDHILSINKPGDFVSLLHLFSNSFYQYSIAALEETRACEVELEAIIHLVKTNGDFALNIMKRMGLIADEVISNLFSNAQLQIRGKVASIILYFSDQVYNKQKFKLPVTRREMAELIAMSTENVIRTLSEFKTDEILHFNGKEVTILDYQRLVAISKKG
jgi:CRP/FNR family transcriptional regulator